MGRPKVPRDIPPHFATGAEQGAARAAAVAAGDKFSLDQDCIDGVMCHGIRDHESGKFHPRPTMTRSAVFDEVKQLNSGAPANNIARGIAHSEKRKHPIKSRDPLALTASEWIERLVYDIETGRELTELRAKGASLSRDKLLKLMAKVAERDRGNFIDDDSLAEAVSVQLNRKFGIRRGTF